MRAFRRDSSTNLLSHLDENPAGDVIRLIKLARCPEPDPRQSTDAYDVVDARGKVLASEPWPWLANRLARELPSAKEIRRRSDGAVVYTCKRPVRALPYAALIEPAKAAS